jgi:hypothetical protein
VGAAARYSGHGNQVPDLDGEEPDKLDETWCLYDGQMIDDELYRMYGALAEGVRVLILSDSCHSGTVAKGMFYSWPACRPGAGTSMVGGGPRAPPMARNSCRPTWR